MGSLLSKNDIRRAVVESFSSDGNAVCRIDGFPVFVPFAAPGDEADIRIVKVKKQFAYGIIERLLVPSADRIAPDCPAFGRCGGCCFRHISYESELAHKRRFAEDALRRIGGLPLSVSRILAGDSPDRYRSKVQFPVCGQPPRYGLYAARSHRLVPCGDCRLQPALLNEIASVSCCLLGELGAAGYDEQTGTGDIRHLLLRANSALTEVLVTVVANRLSFPWEKTFARRLTERFPAVRTVALNCNTRDTNVILGSTTRTLLGPGYISDRLCGVPVAVDTHSFCQINHSAAERLYGEIGRLAALTGTETVLDLYCGAGTIGLSLAGSFSRLIGVETVPTAVESARRAAAEMGVPHAEFFCADAGQAAERLVRRGETIDVIVTDPPRAGCDRLTLDSMLALSPARIVMVSCNAATAARDCRYLCGNGYRAEEAVAVDLFPRTEHVETVVLLSKGEIDSKKVRVDFSLEGMDMSGFQKGATYDQIKAYVLEHSGMKVSSLYISQVKRKCGLVVGQNYNLPKTENAKQLQCPPEKELAIREAFNYFGML